MVEHRIINDRYEVGELIGRGGMADVYMGKDIRLGRAVAIKMMRPDLARDSQFQTRFRREAQSSAALNHPNIVAVFDTGEEELPATADHANISCPFMVMEYVSGDTLRQKLRDGGVTEEQAVIWTTGVLEAIAYSHQNDIVHRDIKPANVMLTDDDVVKVMDFGIARALSDSSATMTQTQAVVGTAQYLSPEQARGESVDFRSDLYSVGCLLFELLTGRPPFVGDSPVAVAYQHVREEPPAPSTINRELTPGLDSVLFKALSKDKADRFQTAAEFSTALNAAYHHGTEVSDNDADATQAMPLAGLGAAGLGAAAAQDADATQAMPAAAEEISAESADPLVLDEPEYAITPEEEVFVQTEDETEAKERSGSKRALIAILVLLALAGLAAGGWYAWDQYQKRQIEANEVQVPDVSGMEESEALNTISDADLRGKTKKVHDDSVPAGEVVETDPASGTTVQRYDEITLMVSLGPEQVVIPEDLAGASEATVRDALEQLGLQVSGVTEVNSPTVERDRLVDTNPSLGSKVPYGSTVSLKMSTGTVQVPDVVGHTEEQARAALEADDVRLSVRTTEKETDEAPEGTVIAQTPGSGQEVEQRSTVELTIAKKPKPTPSPTPTPTETESPSPSDEESSESPSADDDESPEAKSANSNPNHNANSNSRSRGSRESFGNG